jgi:hypothetical protein
MKITIELTDAQASVLLVFCERLSSTPGMSVIPDLQLLQSAAMVIAATLLQERAMAEMQGTAEMDARVGLPPEGQS